MCSMKSSSRVSEPFAPTPPRFCARNSLSCVRLIYPRWGDGDDHVVIGIEILGIEVAGGVVYVGAARVAILVAYLD